MSDVFISYAHEDQEVVRRMAQALEAEGFSVWWDHQIPPGKTWDEVIAKGIEDAKACIVLWSQHSAGSEFVKEEASIAREGRKYLPAQLDDTTLPVGFRRIQAAHLGRWTGDRADPQWVMLVREARTLVGAPSSPPRPYKAPSYAPPPPPSSSSSASSKAGPIVAVIGGLAVLVAILLYASQMMRPPTPATTAIASTETVDTSMTPPPVDTATTGPSDTSSQIEIANLRRERDDALAARQAAEQQAAADRASAASVAAAQSAQRDMIVGSWHGYTRWRKADGSTAGNENWSVRFNSDGTFNSLTDSDHGTWSIANNHLSFHFGTAPYSTMDGTVANGVAEGSGAVDEWTGTFRFTKN